MFERKGTRPTVERQQKLAQQILEHFRANPGDRLNEPAVASRFGIKVPVARRILKDLARDGDLACAFVMGGMAQYFVATRETFHTKRIVGRGVLTGWEAGLRRAAELRMAPRGAGWKL